MSRMQATDNPRVGICLPLMVSAFAFIGGCATTAPAASDARPASWATAVAAGPALPNLYRVNAALYRSALLSRAGFELLESRVSLVPGDPPINTVVSLRAFNDDRSLVEADSTLRLEQISFKTWHAENEDVVKFLRIVTTPALQPVLVHCRHGSDRTGAMVAVYRVVVEGWTKAQAKDEMIHGGFGFHPLWQNLLRYIDALDVEALRAEVAAQGPWQ